MKSCKKEKKGIILILVLWVLFFLSVVALTLGFKNRINIRLRSYNDEELRIFYLAKEGISYAAAELSKDEMGFDCFNDEWSKDFSLQKDEGLLSYKVIDEDRFININTAPEEILNNIKVVYPEITAEIISSIVSKRPFNVTQELLETTAIEQKVFYGDETLGIAGMKDLITVFSDGKININTAPSGVLMMIPAITQVAADSIIARRQSSPFEKNETLSEELSLLGLTATQVSSLVKYTKVNSSVFRIKAHTVSKRKRLSKSVEVVLARSAVADAIDRRKKKFLVLFFKEK